MDAAEQPSSGEKMQNFEARDFITDRPLHRLRELRVIGRLPHRGIDQVILEDPDQVPHAIVAEIAEFADVALGRCLEGLGADVAGRHGRRHGPEFLRYGRRRPVHGGSLARMNTTDDQPEAEPTLMNGPVPTGATPGERYVLNAWGKALEIVGRRHDDLPGIRRGLKLQEANTEDQKKSDAE